MLGARGIVAKDKWNPRSRVRCGKSTNVLQALQKQAWLHRCHTATQHSKWLVIPECIKPSLELHKKCEIPSAIFHADCMPT